MRHISPMIKLTKAQIKLLDAEQKAHLKYTKEQDKRIKKLAKQFGLSNDDEIWDYVVNGPNRTIVSLDCLD